MILEYTPVTQCILCLIFLTYVLVATIQHLSYNTQESKRQSALYDSEKSVTLKQGHSHPTWYEVVDPKQGYNYAKFSGLHMNSVHKKDTVKVFVKSGNTCMKF